MGVLMLWAGVAEPAAFRKSLAARACGSCPPGNIPSLPVMLANYPKEAASGPRAQPLPVINRLPQTHRFVPESARFGYNILTMEFACDRRSR